MPLSREADRLRQARNRGELGSPERAEYNRKAAEYQRRRRALDPEVRAADNSARAQRRLDEKAARTVGSESKVRWKPTNEELRAAAESDELRELVEEQIRDDETIISSAGRNLTSLEAYRGSIEEDEDSSYESVIGYEYDFETGEETPVNFLPHGPMFKSARTIQRRGPYRKRVAA